jgi:hypothetical protein
MNFKMWMYKLCAMDLSDKLRRGLRNKKYSYIIASVENSAIFGGSESVSYFSI